MLVLVGLMVACGTTPATGTQTSSDTPATNDVTAVASAVDIDHSASDDASPPQTNPVLVYPRSCYSRETEAECEELSAAESFMAAEFEAPMAIRNNCVYLIYPGDSEDETFHAIVFPFGTAWSSEQQAVVLANGDFVHDGEWIYGGGGGSSLHDGTGELLGTPLTNQLRSCMSYRGVDHDRYWQAGWGGTVSKIPDPTVSVP